MKLTYKQYATLISSLTLLSTTLSSCDDNWLTEPSPGVSKLDDFFSGADAAQQIIIGAYTPLMWEYANTFFPEWFIGDVVSDDAIKGGQNTNDMADVYDMENWKTMPNSTFLLDFYRAQYQGIGRANLAIEQISAMHLTDDFDADKQNQLVAEAQFLRAYYYFRLVRVFGGVPLVDFVDDDDDKWQQPRATANEIFAFIKNDLQQAEPFLPLKSKQATTDYGRATKGAAQAMLLKVCLYTQDYTEAKKWAEKIIDSDEYSLCDNYADNFTLEGENGPESIFEIQYTEDPTSDYGEGMGFTRGTFTTILIRSRSTSFGDAGWGFNKPTQNLFDEFEPTDPRRDITILNPTDEQIENQAQETYLGNQFINKKYGLYNAESTAVSYKLTHATRSPMNNRQIRYSDVLLMYAEACEALGLNTNAIDALNKVRNRVGLTDYPGYSIQINGQTITPDLRTAIRHERRVELAMEGHRWFDLCRWGIAKQVMDAYATTETDEAQAQMATFVEGKHELFPIPTKELDLNPTMKQNPGY